MFHLSYTLRVPGFDLRNSNINNAILDGMKPERIPDVILVKKVFDKTLRRKRRAWKLKRMVVGGKEISDSASVENTYEVLFIIYDWLLADRCKGHESEFLNKV